MAEGKSNKEIADSLNIGYGTVKQHLFVIFRKLNVTNRAKAVIAAHQLMQNRPPQIYGEAQAMNGMTYRCAQFVEPRPPMSGSE